MANFINLKNKKAERDLENFLKENPEMREKQAELNLKLSVLSQKEKIVFLAKEMENQLTLLKKQLGELSEELEKRRRNLDEK